MKIINLTLGTLRHSLVTLGLLQEIREGHQKPEHIDDIGIIHNDKPKHPDVTVTSIEAR